MTFAPQRCRWSRRRDLPSNPCPGNRERFTGSLPHNKRGVKADEITLTPLELIERIAKLVPSAAHAPPPLLWRAGTELTLEACRHGAGA